MWNIIPLSHKITQTFLDHLVQIIKIPFCQKICESAKLNKTELLLFHLTDFYGGAIAALHSTQLLLSLKLSKVLLAVMCDP